MALNPLIAFIIGLLIIFIVTYIAGFVIVKSKKIKKFNISLIMGFIFLIFLIGKGFLI